MRPARPSLVVIALGLALTVPPAPAGAQRADGRAVFVLVDRDVAPKPGAYHTCVRRET